MSDMWDKSPPPEMPVAHSLTPIGSPCEPFLNAVCGLLHVYFLLADQPSGISDETSCESCKVSSFGESRSNVGTQSWFDKGSNRCIYIYYESGGT